MGGSEGVTLKIYMVFDIVRKIISGIDAKFGWVGGWVQELASIDAKSDASRLLSDP